MSVTKQFLFDAMKGRISMSAIKEYSDENVIFGKFGIVSWMGDYWDIWITGVHQGKELGARKVNNLVSALPACVGEVDRKLKREATTLVRDDETAFQIAVLLGARKKRQVSPEELERLRERGYWLKNLGNKNDQTNNSNS